MTPIKANKLLKALLVAAIVASAALLYLGFQLLNSTAQKTATLKAQVQVSQQQAKIYAKNKEHVDSLGYVNELAKEVLPADQDQSAIVAEISEFAARSQLGISAITFDSAAQGASVKDAKGAPATKSLPGGVSLVPITVELKKDSSYSNVLAYLKTLEANRRKMQVTSIAITPSETDKNLLQSVVIKLNLYAKKSTGVNK